MIREVTIFRGPVKNSSSFVIVYLCCFTSNLHAFKFLSSRLNKQADISSKTILQKIAEGPSSEKIQKNSNALQLNTCVQTVETAFQPTRPSSVSRSAQCVSLNLQDFSRSCQYSQTTDTNAAVRDSGCQTPGAKKRTSVPLGIDAFTQTDLLDENEGLSSRDARVLLDFLEYGQNVCAMHTQTIESELAPFLLESTSIETQTFACETDLYDLPNVESLPLSPAMSTESLSTQTPAFINELFDELVQESVDMQTQTLDGLDNCAVWDFTDADTQTCGYRYSPFETRNY